MYDGNTRGDIGEFQLTVSREADAYTLALSGELDIASCTELEEELDLAEMSSVKLIVLDLRELDFIDSSGLHAIVNAHRHVAGRLIVVRGPSQVQRMFELCALDELLTIVDAPPSGGQTDGSTARPHLAAEGPLGPRLREVAAVGTTRRANQAVIAAIRELRSRRRLRSIR
jgi:anti-anti-sigma factor